MTVHAAPLDAAALLSAVPALLGFIPERSLVLVCMRTRSRVRVAMRYDLSLSADGVPDDDLLATLDALGSIIGRQGGGPIVAVIADDRFGSDDLRYQRVMAVAHRFLAGVGGIAQGFVVADFDEREPWELIWESQAAGPTTARRGTRSESGTMSDPRTSPTAVASAVTSGRRILARRSEIAEMLARLPHCQSPACVAAPVGPAEDPAECADLLGELLAAMQELPTADCATIVRLERAVLTLKVRDAALACAVTDLRGGAQDLWRMLTRRLRGSGRASAATLLAHLHYIAGEGAYAGVALDTALAADPHWSLAALLDRALRGGMSPSLLWEMIADSYDCAAEWGIDLGPETLREVG